MNSKSAANAYREAALENAPPLKVVHMLYQGALRFIDQAAQIDPEKEFEAFQEKINRADAIVSELRLSLDHEPAPELTDQLNALYLFVEDRLRTAFLERSLPVTTFAPGRNFGLQLFNPVFEGRATWAIGAFTNSGNPLAADGSGASDLTVTGRVTALPWYSDDGARLVHLGLSASYREPKDDTVQYVSRPEARSFPYVVDTGKFDASSNTLIGLELAGTVDRTWFMAEYMQTDVNSSDLGDPTFGGWYAQVGHFLTKDKKPYDTVRGVFGHPPPLTA